MAHFYSSGINGGIMMFSPCPFLEMLLHPDHFAPQWVSHDLLKTVLVMTTMHSKPRNGPGNILKTFYVVEHEARCAQVAKKGGGTWLMAALV